MKEGDIVKGRITNIKPYGAFVKIDESIDGLIHISEISDGFVKSIEDYLSVGDEVTLEVIKIADNSKVSLSYKTQNKSGRKKRESVEVTTGFKPFESQLKVWMEKYLKGDK
jgi:general stress protein 13